MAVIGAGPASLATMMCARLAKPARIIAIDIDAQRLELAKCKGLADKALDASVLDMGKIEAAVREAADGRGADAVIEAAGGTNTFEMSWRIARPNAVVVVSAMYENDQTLPSMYGKNLTFKTGGVDATGLEEPLSLIGQGLIDTSCLISKRYALNDILKAYRAFETRENGCLKVVITPWKER